MDYGLSCAWAKDVTGLRQIPRAVGCIVNAVVDVFRPFQVLFVTANRNQAGAESLRRDCRERPSFSRPALTRSEASHAFPSFHIQT